MHCGTRMPAIGTLRASHVKIQSVNNIKVSDTQEAKVILQTEQSGVFPMNPQKTTVPQR